MSHVVQAIQVNTLVDNDIETMRLDDMNTYVHRRKKPTHGTSWDSTSGESSGTVKIGNKENKKVVSQTAIEIPTDEDESMRRMRTASENKRVRSGDIFMVTGRVTQIDQEPQNDRNGNIGETSSARRNGDVAIQIEPEEEKATPVDILRSFLLLMYWLGLSTYDPRCGNKSGKTICSFLFKVLFWIIAVIAFVHSLNVTKLNCLIFATDGGMTNFVDAGFCIVPILLDINIARLFAFQHGRIKRMLSCLTELCRSMDRDEQARSQTYLRFVRRLTKFLATTSIIMCIVDISSMVPLMDWSLKKVVLTQSRRMGFGLFLWKPEDIKADSNVTTEINELFGVHLTGYTLLMGFISSIMDLASSLKTETIIDLVIVAGWCFKECIRRQALKVQNINFRTCRTHNDSAELDSPTGDWARYKQLKAANRAINVVFDVILKLMHIQNTMMCAYFLMHLLQSDQSFIESISLVYNILKMGTAYHIAKQSHGYNAVFQQWIRDWAMYSNDKMFLLRVPAILDEMKSEPLGLGSGEFIIGESFILKFIGTVGSIFVLQVDNADLEEIG